jgi:hypothetical protein
MNGWVVSFVRLFPFFASVVVVVVSGDASEAERLQQSIFWEANHCLVCNWYHGSKTILLQRKKTRSRLRPDSSGVSQERAELYRHRTMEQRQGEETKFFEAASRKFVVVEEDEEEQQEGRKERRGRKRRMEAGEVSSLARRFGIVEGRSKDRRRAFYCFLRASSMACCESSSKSHA